MRESVIERARERESERERERWRESEIERARESEKERERIRIRESESEIHLFEPHSIIQNKYFNVIIVYKTWIGRSLLIPYGRYRRGEGEGKGERLGGEKYIERKTYIEGERVSESE